MIEAILDAIAYGLLGIIVFIGFAAYRALKSGPWDTSNVANWFRVFIHLALHSEDFFYMYYVTDDCDGTVPRRARKVFWYLDKDETTDVVGTRPTQAEKW